MEPAEKRVARQKEIILLPYPFTDLKRSKVRPALIVSNDFYNKRSYDCILVPLTTVLKKEPYSVIIGQENLKSGNLLKKSRIKVDKVFSVEKELILLKIGVIDEKTFRKVKTKLSGKPGFFTIG